LEKREGIAYTMIGPELEKALSEFVNTASFALVVALIILVMRACA
jgi:hypothetical protein